MPEGSTVEVLEKPISSAEPLPQSIEASSVGLTERMELKKVEALVKKIGDFYQVPELARRKGLTSEMLIMGSNDYDRNVEDNLRILLLKKGVEIESNLLDKGNEIDRFLSEASGSSVEEENKKIIERNKENVQKIREEAVRTGGIAIPVDETKSQILIRKDSRLDREMVEIHEMIHAMVNRGSEEGSGFHSGDDHGNANEAATQALTLRLLYPDLTDEELMSKVNSGEIQTPYRSYVRQLLATLFATSKDSSPITVKDLARYYFDKEADVQFILLQMNIVQKAPESLKDLITKMFKNDFARKE